MEVRENQQEVDIPSGQVLNLSEQIQYLEGGFITRTIIDSNNGTCKLAALDEGQGRSEHTVPFSALVYLLDGEAQITISGKPYHLKQGEMIKIPANEPHALKALTELKLMSVMIKS
jgi:quercetin dioxygenase-like cupin family protein